MAYQFTAASSQHLSTASTPVSQPVFTLACWANVAANITGVLFGLSTTGGSDRHVLYCFSDRLRCLSGTSAASAEATATQNHPNNQWFHAAGVFSASNNRTVFQNASDSATNTTNISATQSNTILVGSRIFSGSLGTYLTGQIAEVGIWNAALTADEIASLAKGMTCDKVRPQSLVFYAPLVRDLIDAKGGLTITNNNTATVANHPRVYA
jgi:hypothetical protein